jgi:hypothetical protein
VELRKHMMSAFSSVKFRESLQSLGRETLLTSWELIRITVPVIIVTKILEELGLITTLSMLLEPVMNLIGLPGTLGLVWATSMLTTLYGGMAVLAALAPGLDLSVAQVTVLCSAMLIAHSLPIELSISKKAGAPLMPIALLRLGGAIFYCYLLDQFCSGFNIWQQRAELIFSAAPEHLTLPLWSLQQFRNIGMIIFIIFCILLAMRILRSTGVLSLIERILAPVLPFFGMGREAAPITVVGMIMGIGYGGALIIRETSTGKMAKKEIFNSLAMMGLCHGLVEDTLLMVVLGGKLGGILWGRILFSLIVIFILVRLLSLLPTKVNYSTS